MGFDHYVDCERERDLLYNLVLSKREKVVKSKQQQAFKSCYFSQKVIIRVQNSNAHNNRLSLLFEQKLLRQHFNKQAIVYETFLSLTTVTVTTAAASRLQPASKHSILLLFIELE